MKFSDFVHAKAIKPELDSSDKESVIRELIGSLIACGKLQAEDGIRDPLWSRGLGDVYKRQRQRDR